MPYHLTFARAKEFMDGRRKGSEHDQAKLENQTYLKRFVLGREDVESFGVMLFGKLILELFQDGKIYVRDHGYFGHTTHDRFNKYLPRGFRVHGETIRAFGTGPFGFLSTPTGVKPYRDEMYLNEAGDLLYRRSNLEPFVTGPYNGYNCRAVMYAIPGYAAELMKKLYSGTMERPAEARCEVCERWPSSNRHNWFGGECAAVHIQENVMCSELLETALLTKEQRGHALDCLRVLWKDGYVRIHQKSRKLDDVADRMEYWVKYEKEGPLPSTDPRPHRPRFRRNVMEGLAEALGCERREWNRR